MRTVNGIMIPDFDTHFESAILAGPLLDGKGTYQLQKLNLAMEHVPGARHGFALDVGGHIGLWSRVLDMLFDRVVAFEPVPALAACFRLNAPGVELHEVALSEPGTNGAELPFMRVYDNSGNCRVMTASDNTNPPAPPFLVPVRTLDSFNFTGVDFLKIDVEGFELRVVEGAHDTIKLNKPIIVVEQKPGHSDRYGYGETAAVNLLRSWGYQVMWKKAGDYCMVWSK